MEKQTRIESFWTDQPSNALKNDFIRLANTVFGPFIDDSYYQKKFVDDLYGPSLVTVAYVDGTPAGADVLWRNDLDGRVAYQTVDTCVLEQFRGKGLFKRITQYELDLLGSETFVYGFPNGNSYPGYVKMGWLVRHFYKTLCRPPKGAEIDPRYALWWIKAQPGIGRIHRNGHDYLVRKSKSTPMATLIGKVDAETAKEFPETAGIWLLKHFDTKPSIYNENRTIPLVCNKMQMEVPYWKIDAI